MPKQEIFDAHVHLQMYGKTSEKTGKINPPLEQVMQKAKQTDVTHFLCNATSEDDWQEVIDIAKHYKGVHIALGVHPWYMHTLKAGWEKRLEELLKNNPNFLVGEIGLDKDRPDMWTQTNVFKIQLSLAHKYNRPAIIHCGRGSWEHVKQALKEQKLIDQMPPRILSHSHHGDCNLTTFLAKEYNAYFSYSALISWPKCVKVRECLKSTPLDRMLVESDGPDLTPEPADVSGLTDQIATIAGYDPKRLKQALFDNAKEFVKC